MDDPNSPEARRARRRARRLKRRVRALGPFLALPIVLGALALSIDLVEYRPAKPAARSSDRPLPGRVTDSRDEATAARARSLATASVISASDLGPEHPSAMDPADGRLAFDWSRPAGATLPPPAPPSTLGVPRR